MTARRAATNAFIAFHLVAVAVFVSPGRTPLLDAAARLVQPYLAFTGLWQYWDMFAPEPAYVNFRVEARVTFRDGTSTLWLFPGPEGKGPIAAYRMERLRKWRDAIRVDENEEVWPDTARWVARVFANPANPPAKIELIRRWEDVPAPASGDYQAIEPAAYAESFTFFAYDVSPEDLE